MRVLAVLLAVWVLPSLAAEKWEIQLFHDEDKSSLTLNDIKFASPRRGVAVGYLIEKGSGPKGTAVVTSDGGKHWSYVPTKEVGRSLFFLNDTAGWMVTDRGIWFTDESGRSWRRILKQQGLNRVLFTTPERGWAVGSPKLLLSTKDGGKTWAKVPEAAKPPTNPLYSSYNALDFANPKVGLVAGTSRAPRRNQHLPVWADTDARKHTELPATVIVMQTKDGGESWISSVASVFGTVTQVRFAPDGRMLALLEFHDYFDWPSEVVRIDWKTGNSTRALLAKDRAITDIALVSPGPAYAAGFEPQGKLAHSPVPGKLKVLRSLDLEHWTEIPVDYRAVARRAAISAADARNIWIATDTGMILKLRVAD
jgi:Uncharacterized protein related to plant photosystem II stability/assembly factor